MSYQPYTIKSAQKLFVQWSHDIEWDYSNGKFPSGDESIFDWEERYIPVEHTLNGKTIGATVWRREKVGDNGQWTLPIKLTGFFVPTNEEGNAVKAIWVEEDGTIKYQLDNDEIIIAGKVENGTIGNTIISTDLTNDVLSLVGNISNLSTDLSTLKELSVNLTTTSNEFSGIPSGTVYPRTTPLEEILIDLLTGIGGGGAVTSVFGRNGIITAQTNDYTWSQINKTISNISDITNRSHNSLTNIGNNTHNDIDLHIADMDNPHNVNKADVGLSNVNDTSDLDKPISTDTQAALDNKANINGWNSITDFNSTPASYNTITTTADLSNTIKPGYALKIVALNPRDTGGTINLNTKVTPTVRNGFSYVCTTSEVIPLNEPEPTWNTNLGGTTTDGLVTWLTVPEESSYVVKDITSNLITVYGYDLTSTTLEEITYAGQEKVDLLTISLTDLIFQQVGTDVLTKYLNIPIEMRTGYLVGVIGWCKTIDTGTDKARLHIRNSSGEDVFFNPTNNETILFNSAETFIDSPGIWAGRNYYTFGDSLRIDIPTPGSNKNTTNARITLMLVIE